jgi:hypothetical protein
MRWPVSLVYQELATPERETNCHRVALECLPHLDPPPDRAVMQRQRPEGPR